MDSCWKRTDSFIFLFFASSDANSWSEAVKNSGIILNIIHGFEILMFFTAYINIFDFQAVEKWPEKLRLKNAYCSEKRRQNGAVTTWNEPVQCSREVILNGVWM